MLAHMARWLGVGALLLLVLGACGSPPPARRPVRAEPVEFPGVILEVLAATDPSWARPDQEIGTLENDARQMRGEERDWANRQLALACLWASENAPSPRVAQAHRRCARKAARAAGRGALAPRPAAMMGIVELWVLWRGGDRSTARIADRYAQRFGTERELLGAAWLLRGEVQFERENWEEAARAYRFVVAELDHPLYVVALYRTAQCWKRMDRESDAQEALREVATHTDDNAPVTKIARAARAELAAPAPH